MSQPRSDETSEEARVGDFSNGTDPDTAGGKPAIDVDGLRLTYADGTDAVDGMENPWSFFQRFDAMEPDEKDRWWLPGLEHDLPFTFSLKAQNPA